MPLTVGSAVLVRPANTRHFRIPKDGTPLRGTIVRVGEATDKGKCKEPLFWVAIEDEWRDQLSAFWKEELEPVEPQAGPTH